jgi:hypothetical protein
MSANRILSNNELEAFKVLFSKVQALIAEVANGDNDLKFAFNRKLYKELAYLERGKPMQRRTLKLQKYAQQRGICAECKLELPEFGKNAHLDRFVAKNGYTLANTELIHGDCHIKRQAAKGYS